MAQQDRDHDIVIQALKAGGWTVTHPGGIATRFGEKGGRIDIGAEIYIAEKGTRKIAVEVKNYPAKGPGVMGDFNRSIGQYLTYREFFAEEDPEREVWQAVPKATYEGFLSSPKSLEFLKKYSIKTFVYDPNTKTIDKWID